MKVSDPFNIIATGGPRIDWSSVRDSIDLAAAVTRHLGPALKRRGRRLYWRCPFHEDHDPSFVVDPTKKRWDCYPCGIGGDAAAFVMRHGSKSFPEAIDYLASRPVPTRPGKAPGKPVARPTPPPPSEPSGMPEADALALVEAAAERLWTPEGADALAYLTGPRRLAPETIRGARLGWTSWVTIPKADRKTFRALGWVIPWFASGRLALVKIRQPDRHGPKYVEAFRAPARLVCYPGPETVRPGRPLVIVEGEFDALALGEALGELAAAVTLGSASARPGPAALGPMLPAAPWFIATDRDEAGDKAAAAWRARARRVRPPEPFKDWTEARQGGVNLARWWSDRLGGTEAPPLFSWDELAGWRWGSAAADPTPGIIIDQADRGRMLATLETAADDPDERAAIQAE
jgi:hypothetical protein